ncbi:hypothetical protein JCM17845_05050 [Iodidimonas gelatinilytica]|uniref:RecF/RecN/SMC N-terminal domain-containing protein n=1 Tax=Iodidimonas gelatinilytica TaxID=1236966 RepID=A0A5A7MVE2_9PROT|nr:AAA family ATPase [Iodidimonas gelatinilytica]GEQ99881.1 hypothetical protein JCM17845_05050 [Iodidimonas gelatinilytica]
MQFSKLRLSGFKSFVDPTELRIEAGLTGIVGPNGCGKSNLVEALRWVMGENSARSMRGSGMDDVIFAGTSRRPARNLAEVSLTIDNSRRRAPAAFNGEDQLEIVRRIERESGSAYRINGRDVRAKDVQLLFADAATGAHSPAMVSQGRVGALIAAKPKDRRAILEEAAGISGLHSRRREAEQRLKAAENNLVRLQDVLTQLETQSAALKRQARQAERYRTLSNDIRKADAGILYHKWRNALDQARALERDQHEIEQHVGTLTATATKLSAEQTQLAAQLPDLRKAETNAAAHVQRLQMTASQLEADERQRADMLASLERQIQQIQADELREKETHADAKAALSRLDAEQARHKQAQEGQLATEQAARDHLDTCARKAEEAEAAYDAIGQRLAEARGRRASLSSDLTALERRRDRMARDHQETQAAIHAMEEADPDAQAVKTAEIAVAALEKQIADRALKLEEAAAKTAQAREEADQKRAALSQSRSNLASNQADRAALEKRLQARNVNGQASIADQLSVHAGFEQALGAALGEDLNAPLDAADAPTVWHSLPPLSQVPQLPDTAIPLSNHVEGPATLTRRLSQIGVVETDAQLQHLVPALLPGQRLVTKSGGLVRWDGYRMAADAPSAATIRLQQKNRLAVLKAESVELEAKVAVAATAHEQAQSAVQNATKAQALQRTHLDEAESAVRAAKQKLAEAEAEANRRASRLAGLTETLARLTQEMSDAQARCKTIKPLWPNFPLPPIWKPDPEPCGKRLKPPAMHWPRPAPTTTH